MSEASKPTPSVKTKAVSAPKIVQGVLIGGVYQTPEGKKAKVKGVARAEGDAAIFVILEGTEPPLDRALSKAQFFAASKDGPAFTLVSAG